MKKLMILLVLMMLMGCSSNMTWVKPGATQKEFLKDRYQCQFNAETACQWHFIGVRTTGQAIASGITGGMCQGEHFNRCMNSSGYTLINLGR